MAFTSWLNKGTLITLEDGSQKAIESIEVDDTVQTFDMDTEEFDHNLFDPFFNINFKEDLIEAKKIEDNYFL